ncbi:hypothetical protein WJX77_007008 [Trebouxia sp. C0004]
MKSLLMHGSCLCIIAQALSVCTDLACCVGPSHAMGCVLIGEASQTARQNGTMTEAVTLPKSRGVAQEIMVVEGLLDPSLMPELKGMVQALCEDLPELVEEHKERNLSCTLAESDLAAEKWYEGGISDIVLFLQAAPWLQAEFPQWHLWKCDMLRGWIANGTCARWCQVQKDFCEAWRVAKEDTRHPLCPPSAAHALANKFIKHKDVLMRCKTEALYDP